MGYDPPMARAAKKSAKQAPAKKKPVKKRSFAERASAARYWVRKWFWRLVFIGAAGVVIWVVAFSIFDPKKTPYMRTEELRLVEIDHLWVDMEHIAPVMARSVVAAEDANFCNHWGFDMAAIRAAARSGGRRGASTLTQQVVKNVFLWHGRSYTRKALEALITPLVELTWSKRRILEVYLNIAEFDEGVFGVEAAARHYFRVGPEELSATQAARLAALLPSPKTRSASRPSAFVQKRARQIRDGAATIRRDGRAGCFLD